MEGSDVLLEGGYSKPINSVVINQKEELMRAVKMHFTILQCKGELDQLRNGLSVKGVGDVLERHSELFAPLFVSSKAKPLTAGKLFFSVVQ